MKLNHVLRLAAFLIAGGAMGFSLKAWLVHKQPHRYCVQVSGVTVTGELSQFQKDELESIHMEAAKVDSKNSIMSIEFLSSDKVKIMTGDSRGPLSGGGRFFTLQKKNGNWEVLKSESGYWMS